MMKRHPIRLRLLLLILLALSGCSTTWRPPPATTAAQATEAFLACEGTTAEPQPRRTRSGIRWTQPGDGDRKDCLRTYDYSQGRGAVICLPVALDRATRWSCLHLKGFEIQ